MCCNWEGNRRSGVALAMRHRRQWFIHLRAQGLSKGDEHPTNTLHTVWYSLPYTNGSIVSPLPWPHILCLTVFALVVSFVIFSHMVPYSTCQLFSGCKCCKCCITSYRIVLVTCLLVTSYCLLQQTVQRIMGMLCILYQPIENIIWLNWSV